MRPPDEPDLLLRLCRLVARLRGPDGCPWDREQELVDVRAYLLEEAHELAAAIDGGDWPEIREELGDLLFQVAFVARLAEEAGAFTASHAVEAAAAKMIERHPHVFGDHRLEDVAAVHRAWGRRKLEGSASDEPVLGGVAASLPALLASYRMTQKAAGAGFDWARPEAVLEKVEEELAELRRALEPGAAAGGDGAREEAAEELGDLLFTMASLARHLRVDPEAALARANRKFRRRFEAMRRALERRGVSLSDASPEEMDAAWEEVKSKEG